MNSIDDRIKYYESISCSYKLYRNLPIVVRLDGRAFHTFTRSLDKPFDMPFIRLMQDTAMFLAKEFNATIAYTQSDEISLIFYNNDFRSEPLFDGKLFKLNSIIASTCSVFFNRNLSSLKNKQNEMPVFDCRSFNVPSTMEACNYLIWREQDASKNSISMAARALYSHNMLLNQNSKELQELIFQKGINWNDYPSCCKRGTYIQRVKKFTRFTLEELKNLPERHEARKNPDFMVERSVYEIKVLPVLSTIENIEDVIFYRHEPIIKCQK